MLTKEPKPIKFSETDAQRALRPRGLTKPQPLTESRGLASTRSEAQGPRGRDGALAELRVTH